MKGGGKNSRKSKIKQRKQLINERKKTRKKTKK